MTGNLLIAVTIILALPALTCTYFPRTSPLKKHRWWVLLIAYAWLAYAFVHVELSEDMFDVGQQDATYHDFNGMMMAEAINDGDWSYVASHLRFGNRAYHVYLGILYWTTSANALGAVMINMLFAFWGSLTVVALLSDSLPSKRIPGPLLLVTMFPPSMVFWTTTNLKEGAMYWAIAQILTVLIPQAKKKQWRPTKRIALGAAVAGMLRPHVAILWLGAVMIVALVRSGRVWYAVLALAAIPFMVTQITNRVDASLSLSGAQAVMERQREAILDTGGSAVSGKPTFFWSGVQALFFRPFFWEATKLSQLITAAEIWGLTGLVVAMWLRVKPSRRRATLREPLVLASIAACVVFSVWFTWMGNEGLLARQRVQAYPAFVCLISAPWLLQNRTQRVKLSPHMLQRLAKRGVRRVAVRTRAPQRGPVGDSVAPVAAEIA